MSTSVVSLPADRPKLTQLLARPEIKGVARLLSGVVAVIAFANANRLRGRGRAAIFPALVPAVAISLGVPIAGELPTWLQLAGLAFVSLGLLVTLDVVRLGRRTATPA